MGKGVLYYAAYLRYYTGEGERKTCKFRLQGNKELLPVKTRNEGYRERAYKNLAATEI